MYSSSYYCPAMIIKKILFGITLSSIFVVALAAKSSAGNSSSSTGGGGGGATLTNSATLGADQIDNVIASYCALPILAQQLKNDMPNDVRKLLVIEPADAAALVNYQPALQEVNRIISDYSSLIGNEKNNITTPKPEPKPEQIKPPKPPKPQTEFTFSANNFLPGLPTAATDLAAISSLLSVFNHQITTTGSTSTPATDQTFLIEVEHLFPNSFLDSAQVLPNFDLSINKSIFYDTYLKAKNIQQDALKVTQTMQPVFLKTDMGISFSAQQSSIDARLKNISDALYSATVSPVSLTSI